jgi:hypothetical protein
MRLRSQAEIDELFWQNGFEKLDMQIDTYGIFSVAIAQKKRPESAQSITREFHNQQFENLL